MIKLLIAFIIGIIIGSAGVLTVTVGDIFGIGTTVIDKTQLFLEDHACEQSLRELKQEIEHLLEKK